MAGPRLAEALPGARLAGIPNGPHAIMWTHAAEVNQRSLASCVPWRRADCRAAIGVGGLCWLAQELGDVGGERGVVLEEEPVRGVRVDLQLCLGDQASQQVGVARQDHGVAVAVGDEHGHLKG
jgi:hypothetical protein